jgi:hypothetical protein
MIDDHHHYNTRTKQYNNLIDLEHQIAVNIQLK